MTCAIVTPPSLDATLQLRRFSRHESISLLPDVLCCIESGVVSTATLNEEGTLITMGYWGAGDVVGLPMSRLPLYEAQCLTNVAVRQLPKQRWSEVFDVIVKQTQQIEELQTIMHQNSMRLRLWRLLGYLGEKFGQEVETGRLIDLPLTRELLAQTIRATWVTVTRLLQQFEAEGKLQRNGRQIILQNEC